ncbi:hypothetical protein [Nitrogeniibacter aestuarii]|uniref:hypothetical protein n=1 Tax=Nitrogeniibacter aestuarii TaxID=2815343 RepID=UPI001D115BB1|nr:hypothetical protein [Nitrogeniibacter aestuarii]
MSRNVIGVCMSTLSAIALSACVQNPPRSDRMAETDPAPVGSPRDGLEVDVRDHRQKDGASVRDHRKPVVVTQIRTKTGDWIRVTAVSGAKLKGRITTCLRNKTSAGVWKGMHWSRVVASKVAYTAKGKGAEACDTQPAVGQRTWHLYKAQTLGAKNAVATFSLDQQKYRDKTIYLDWIRD